MALRATQYIIEKKNVDFFQFQVVMSLVNLCDAFVSLSNGIEG
jgi:hypothetical protein